MGCVMSIILLGISGDLHPRTCPGGSDCAAIGLGITAGVFGMLLSILAIIFVLHSELYESSLVKWIIVAGLAFTALLAVIAAIIYATLFRLGLFAAGMFFGFFTTIAAVLTVVFTFLSGQ